MKRVFAIAILIAIMALLFEGCSVRWEINPEKAQVELAQVG